MRPGLVIFDCDGVLVDTERRANEILVDVLARDGYAITYAQSRERFVGRSAVSIQKMVEAETGRALGADWTDRLGQETEAAFRGTISAIPGVRAVIEALKAAGVPVCVASSGTLGKMAITLGGSGLLELLEPSIFSATMVANGKPAPDLFLHAAREMGPAPDECVVIEDSVPGVMAGRAAGMRVLGYAGDPETDAAALEAQGAEVFTTMDALPQLLGL